MNDLVQLEPTVDDFKKNPTSIRHAYLACVATYHAIDRVAYPKPRGNLRKMWRQICQEFAIADVVAHDFKHVKSNEQKPPIRSIPLSFAAYGRTGFNTHAFNDTGQLSALRNLVYVVQEAVKFLYQQANPKILTVAGMLPTRGGSSAK